MREVEIHLPDELNNLFDGIEIADIDEGEFAAALDESRVGQRTSVRLLRAGALHSLDVTVAARPVG